jgi:hypothetical protein
MFGANPLEGPVAINIAGTSPLENADTTGMTLSEVDASPAGARADRQHNSKRLGRERTRRRR